MKIYLEMGSEFNRTIAELSASGTNIVLACSEGLAEGVKFAANKVVNEHLIGQDLQTRTGNLKRAVDGWLEAPLDGIVGVREKSAVDAYKWLLGTEQKTITPKNAAFLCIPIGAGLTAAGVARYASPRQVPNGFFFKGKSGGLFFGIKTGKTDRSIKALFILKKSVTVTGSGALLAGVLDSVDNITQSISDKIGNKI